ncbi:hypothetical protein ACFL2A_00985 [Thermodesulfobacteriota bacterium]
MVDTSIAGFFDDYVEVLDNLDYKVAFFKNLSDKAYIEIARLLPEINTNLKGIVSILEEDIFLLNESGIEQKELEEVNRIIDELKSIRIIILSIMTSLQIQDTVNQCIAHIISSVSFARELMSDTDSSCLDEEYFKTIKFLKVLPELIVAQLQNVYKKMDDSLCFLPRRFQAIHKILKPPISLENLLEGAHEKSSLELLKEELVRVREKNDSVKAEEALLSTLTRVEGLEREIPENAHLLDQSSAAPRSLQQPLTEILFMNESLMQASECAENLIRDHYDGSFESLDCAKLFETVVNLFSTKDELEIARTIIKEVEIEECGAEGELELF